MRNECVHMSLEDIYKDVSNSPMLLVVFYSITLFLYIPANTLQYIHASCGLVPTSSVPIAYPVIVMLISSMPAYSALVIDFIVICSVSAVVLSPGVRVVISSLPYAYTPSSTSSQLLSKSNVYNFSPLSTVGISTFINTYMSSVASLSMVGLVENESPGPISPLVNPVLRLNRNIVFF